MKLATTIRRIGSIPGCIALGCVDVGEAILENGEKVITTWGLNINDPEQIKLHEEKSHFELIQHELKENGRCEVILPQHIADKLLPILVAK